MNPFFREYETVPFEEIKNEHFLPAIEEGIVRGKKDVEFIIKNLDDPTFENTIEALETAGSLLSKVSTVFFNLNSAETNDEMQKLAQEISPKLSAYSNDINLDPKLFERVKNVYDLRDTLELDVEQKTLLEKTYKGFVRNGALLDQNDKDKLRMIDEELSKTSLSFGENVLKESNSFEMYLTDESDLEGLPDSAIEAASMMAKQKGKENGWVITLDYPSYVPFMKYSAKRDLREKLYKAFGSKSCKGDDHDNKANVLKIARLRKERAQLLGYNTHADFVLEERMAGGSDVVLKFLQEILEVAMPIAKKETSELQEFAKSINPQIELQKWDSSYFSEKLRKKYFDLDEEMLKPYFKLENVIDGVFKTAHLLYDLDFEKVDDIQVYHEEVMVYKVTVKGKELALFYADFFPREGKRQGAWMTSYRGQKTGQRPHVSIVCNFTKPTGTKPSLLTFNEVTTLFHEFGHALHGMLANGKYESVSGTSVFWDFVELPSQILENWCYEKECLDLFARHYETGESIPQELIDKIKNAANFQSGMQTVRQVSFGKLDMDWHSVSTDVVSVDELESESMSGTELLPKVEGINMSCQFSHIFQGGYSAGYYSYKWAEVLDADAFESFKEKGVFNKDVATSFKENILSKGGSEHPMILYKRFKGKEPDPKALLRRAGLI